MKKITPLILAALLAVAARAADSVPLFNATLTMGKEHRFVLVSAAGKASAFLSLGETFEGYTLKAFDVKASTLDLERDGKITRVTLVGDASITSGAMPAVPSGPATVADAEAMLKVMHFEEMMKKIAEGQQKAMAPMFQQMTAQMRAQGVEAEKVQAFQKKIAESIMGVMTDPETQKAMASAYAETFTKDELNSLATFYSTPVGQSLIEKQPAVSQKLNESLMPRMMQVMQNVQQSAREEFGRGGAQKGGGPAMPPATPPPTKQ